jgi:hypothetical protein
VEGGSCNDYDYVCGDPVNGFDLDGRKGNRPLENRDAECLGGTYAQITSDPCRAYQLAKVTGNSDFYYEGKTYSTPGKPNAALKYIGDRLKPVLVDRAGETLRLCAEGARAGAAVGAVAAAQTSAASVAAGAIGGCAPTSALQWQASLSRRVPLFSHSWTTLSTRINSFRVSAVGFDTKENGGSDHRRGLRQRSRSVLLAVTGWDVLAFCVVLVVIIGFEYSKVMFREDYSLSRWLNSL